MKTDQLELQPGRKIKTYGQEATVESVEEVDGTIIVNLRTGIVVPGPEYTTRVIHLDEVQEYL